MAIPAGARKCPYCRVAQSRLSLAACHPAFAAAWLCLAIVLFGGVIALVGGWARGRDFEACKDQVVVTESRVVCRETKSGAEVVVAGTITNRSRVSWTAVWFHADFADAAGRRTDVGQAAESPLCLPAGAATPFEISFRREFAETNYARHTIRVSAAKSVRP